MKRKIVAVIDSGISTSFSFNTDIAGGVGFCAENGSVFMTDDFQDNNGHGTMCAHIIKKYCPEAMLYIVKVLNDEARGHSLLLMLALKHLLEVDVDIINISMSIRDTQYEQDIRNIMKMLGKQGKILNVSVANGMNTSFPASFDSCFGIRGSESCSGLIYNSSDPIQLTVRLFPEFVESVDREYQWFGGNSKSTAAISGIAAKALMEKQEGADPIEFFSNYLNENQNDLFKFSETEYPINEKINDAFAKCYDIFQKYVDCTEISLYTPLIEGNRSMIEKPYEMILQCQHKLSVRIPCHKLCCTDFTSIKHFLAFALYHG